MSTKKKYKPFNENIIEELNHFMSPSAIMHEISHRRTGRSLGLAFKTISQAFENPNEDIKVIDHYDTHESNKNLLNIIKDLVKTNKLKGFSFGIRNLTIKYNLEIEYKEEYYKMCRKILNYYGS